MNPRPLVVAGMRLEVAPEKMTWLEAIHKNNMAGKTIIPNRGHNRIFLSRDGERRFKPSPHEISSKELLYRKFYTGLYTGTFGVIGNKGKPLGKWLETEAEYDGRRKVIIIETEGAPADVMLCCDHGFGKDGLPNHQFFDARTAKPISTREGMLEPGEVCLRFNGEIYTFVVRWREGGLLEAIGGAGGVDTFSWLPDSAACGLLGRGFAFGDGSRQGAGLYNLPSDRFWAVMAWEAGAPLLEEVESLRSRLDGIIESLKGSAAQLEKMRGESAQIRRKFEELGQLNELADSAEEMAKSALEGYVDVGYVRECVNRLEGMSSTFL